MNYSLQTSYYLIIVITWELENWPVKHKLHVCEDEEIQLTSTSMSIPHSLEETINTYN